MLNYAFIGCGVASTVHLNYLKNHKKINIVALCDPSLSIPTGFQQLNIPIYQDYKEMLAKESLDAITIASPHYLHYEQILACAKKNIHILCEKPLAINYQDALIAVNECQNANIKLQVMLQRRYFHHTQTLKQVIEQQALGQITQVTYELNVNKKEEYYQGWRGKKEQAGGGVLLCQGLHDLDRIIDCFGKPQVLSSSIKTTREYIDIEDEATATLMLPQNIPWHITATANAPTLWSGKISITGTKGSIVIDAEKVLEWNVPNFPAPQIDKKPNRSFVPPYYDPCHEEVIEDFIQSILNNKEPSINGKSTLPALQTLFEIYDRSTKN